MEGWMDGGMEGWTDGGMEAWRGGGRWKRGMGMGDEDDKLKTVNSYLLSTPTEFTGSISHHSPFMNTPYLQST